MSESDKGDDRIAGFNFDDLVAAALSEKGLTIPISPAEVTRAEEEINEDEIDLPDSLKNPFSFLDSKRQPALLHFPQSSQPSGGCSEELARVAREGGEIPDEIARRMREDRLEAEKRKNDGDQE